MKRQRRNERRDRLEAALLSYFAVLGECVIKATEEMELLDFAVLVHRFMDAVEEGKKSYDVRDARLMGLLAMYEDDVTTKELCDKFVECFKSLN